MFEVEKTYSFEAGHVLSYHAGKCSTPHGHNYVLRVVIRGQKLGTSGSSKNMLIDFDEISRVVKPMLEEFFDHKWLNDSLNCESPTAEFIAQWIFEYLKTRLDGLFFIQIEETPRSIARYYGSF